MRTLTKRIIAVAVASIAVIGWISYDDTEVGYRLGNCAAAIVHGVRPLATRREDRFLGKVKEYNAACRGGYGTVAHIGTPWVDWSNYFDTADSTRRSGPPFNRGLLGLANLGTNGALVDLEYERMELIRFNLFDNSGTYREYVEGRNGVPGPILRTWAAMRLPPNHPSYADVGGAEAQQTCKGALIRSRNLTGICNDIRNPLMGSTGTLFARNVQFETTFPDAGLTSDTRARHATPAAST